MTRLSPARDLKTMNYSNMPAETVSEIEEIDQQLAELDEKEADLLEQRSRLVEDSI